MPDVGGYLFATDPGEPDLFSYVAGALLLLALLVGLFLYFRRRQLFGKVPVRARLMGNTGLYLAIVGGIGVAFALLNFVRVPLLGSRFWLAGLLLALVAVLFWFMYYSQWRLPALAERYRQATLREQYMTRPGAGRSGRRRGVKKRH